jgi:mRNA interferase RelE/StbE
LAWTIEYTETALRWLRKTDRQVARRILDFMDERVAKVDDPRGMGKALSNQFSGLWRYRIGDYRLIRDLQDERLCVLVVEIGNRREIYR